MFSRLPRQSPAAEGLTFPAIYPAKKSSLIPEVLNRYSAYGLDAIPAARRDIMGWRLTEAGKVSVISHATAQIEGALALERGASISPHSHLRIVGSSFDELSQDTTTVSHTGRRRADYPPQSHPWRKAGCY